MVLICLQFCFRYMLCPIICCLNLSTLNNIFLVVDGKSGKSKRLVNLGYCRLCFAKRHLISFLSIYVTIVSTFVSSDYPKLLTDILG